MRILRTILCVGLCGFSAVAGEYWVGPGTTGTGTGTSSSDPIQISPNAADFDAQMAAFTDNDIVHLEGGTYYTLGRQYPVSPSGWWVKPGERIIGAGMDQTLIQYVGTNSWNTIISTYDGFVTNTVPSGMEVSDLTVDCNPPSGTQPKLLQAVELNGTGCTIRNVKAVNCIGTMAECFPLQIDTCVIIGGTLMPSSGNLIEQCVVTNVLGGGVSAIQLNAGGGWLGPCISGTIRNNRVYFDPTTVNNNSQFGINGSGVRDYVVTGNYVEGAGAGYYIDTIGQNSVFAADNHFTNCLQGFAILANNGNPGYPNFYDITVEPPVTNRNFILSRNLVEIRPDGWGFRLGHDFAIAAGPTMDNCSISANVVRAIGTPVTGSFVAAGDVSNLSIYNNAVTKGLGISLTNCIPNLGLNTDLSGDPIPDLSSFQSGVDGFSNVQIKSSSGNLNSTTVSDGGSGLSIYNDTSTTGGDWYFRVNSASGMVDRLKLTEGTSQGYLSLFSPSGSETVRINSSGDSFLDALNTSKFGIGTSSPQQKLDVNGTIQSTGLKMTTGATTGYVLTSDSSGTAAWAALPTGLPPTGAASGDLTGTYPSPQIASNEALLNKVTGGGMTSSSGNVGVGTSSPFAKLDINGKLRLRSTGVSSSWAGHTTTITDDGGLMSITNYCEMEAAQWWWAVQSNNAPYPPMPAVVVQGTGDGGILGLYSSASLQTIHLNGGGDSYINSSGNLGVGTTSPGSKLDVNGTVQLTGFKLSTSPTSGYTLTSDSSGTGTWQPITTLVPSSNAVQGYNEQTLSADLSLGSNAARIQHLTASGADRNVTLPSYASGREFFIQNVGTANTLVIKDSNGTEQARLLPGWIAMAVSHSASWLVQAFPKSSPFTVSYTAINAKSTGNYNLLVVPTNMAFIATEIDVETTTKSGTLTTAASISLGSSTSTTGIIAATALSTSATSGTYQALSPKVNALVLTNGTTLTFAVTAAATGTSLTDTINANVTGYFR